MRGALFLKKVEITGRFFEGGAFLKILNFEFTHKTFCGTPTQFLSSLVKKSGPLKTQFKELLFLNVVQELIRGLK